MKLFFFSFEVSEDRAEKEPAMSRNEYVLAR